MMIVDALNSFPSVALSHAVSFLVGGLAGFMASRLLAWFETKALKGTVRQRTSRFQGRLSQRVSSLGLAMMILSILCFGVGVRVGYVALNSKVACLDAYANSVADTLDARREFTDRREAAEDKVFDAIPDSVVGAESNDAEELLAAVSEFQRERDAINEDRRESQSPQAPRKVCQ